MDTPTELVLEARAALLNGSPILPHVLAEMLLDTAGVGSFYTCDPPVLTTDVDYVVLTKPGISVDDFLMACADDEWEAQYDDEDYAAHGNEEITFGTARKGQINLIVYDNPFGFDAFLNAAAVSKLLNVTDKDRRKVLFRAVCGRRRN